MPEAPIIIGDTEIERLDNYVYLDQNITAEHNIRREITRRNRAGWNSFNSIKAVLIATAGKSLRSQLFNSTVLPAMSYGSETWSLGQVTTIFLIFMVDEINGGGDIARMRNSMLCTI